MKKEPTSRVASIGVYAVMPKVAIQPRQALQRRVDERDDDKSHKPEQAPPPPGMGKLVDQSA